MIYLTIVLIISILLNIKLLFNEKVKTQNIKISHIINADLMKNFDSYVVILELFMNRAYDIIFKDQILIYSVEATKLDNKHFEEISKQFMTLVLKLMGKTLQQEFEYLYSDKETLLFNITEYFNRRYEDDEIRKASQKNLMEDNEEENINPLTMNL